MAGFGADDELIDGPADSVPSGVGGGFHPSDELVEGANTHAAAAPGQRKPMSRQALGVLESILPIAKNINAVSPANLIPGFREHEQAGEQASQARVDAAHAAGVKADPLTKSLSQVEAGVPLALATRNPALAGGVQGYLGSEAKDPEGRVLDTGVGTLEGYGLGKIAEGVANVAEPLISPAVRMLQRAGVRLTPGQVFGGAKKQAEDANMSVPGVSRDIIEGRNRSLLDFNRGAANRALLPVGIQLPENVRTGHDAVHFLEQQAEQRYQSILPRLRLQVDRRLMSGYVRGHQVASSLDDATRAQFNNIVDRYTQFNNAGRTSGRQLVQMIRGIRGEAFNYLKSDNPMQRTLGEALSQVDDGIRGALSSQNPLLSRQLRMTDRLYRGVRIVSDAASRATDGVSGVGQLAQAVRRADPTKNARATAQGRAYMQNYTNAGAQVIPSQLRDSGTAARIKINQPVEVAKGLLARGRYAIDRAALPVTAREAGPVGRTIARAIRAHPALATAVSGPMGGLLAGLLDGPPQDGR